MIYDVTELARSIQKPTKIAVELAEARAEIARLEAENEKLREKVALYAAALKSVRRFSDSIRLKTVFAHEGCAE